MSNVFTKEKIDQMNLYQAKEILEESYSNKLWKQFQNEEYQVALKKFKDAKKDMEEQEAIAEALAFRFRDTVVQLAKDEEDEEEINDNLTEFMNEATNLMVTDRDYCYSGGWYNGNDVDAFWIPSTC